jgi:uncharacterized protein (TIGR02611 family)
MPKPSEVIRFIGRSSKRVAVTVVGFAVVLGGLAMLVLPGPGILVVIVGLAILASEYAWARRLLTSAKDRAQRARNKLLRRKPPEPKPPVPTEHP